MFLAILLLAGVQVSAQIDLDIKVGTSKADNSFLTLRATYSLSPQTRIGVSHQFSNYQYRFIDARAVSGGFAGTTRLIFLQQLQRSEKIRLDLFVKPGYRTIGLSDEPQELENYDFQPGTSLIIEPGLLVTFNPAEKWSFHSGLNLHTAFQLQPDFLQEQLPSMRLLGGGAYQLSDQWVLFSTLDTGPMSGASGDSEKYFWKAGIGLRYRIGQSQDNLLLIGF